MSMMVIAKSPLTSPPVAGLAPATFLILSVYMLTYSLFVSPTFR